MPSCECPKTSITTRAGTPCASSNDAQVCLLCGIPHNWHYADGRVMCPAAAFVLVGAVSAVFSGA